MTPESLIEAIKAQLRIVPWLHTLHPPFALTEVDVASLSYPYLPMIPKDLLALYQLSNGLDLENIYYKGIIVGTAFGVPALETIKPISLAMYGQEGFAADAVFPDWLCVGRASDAAFFVALDAKDSTYRTISPIIPEEAEVIAASCSDYLSWLIQFLPSGDDIEILKERGAT